MLDDTCMTSSRTWTLLAVWSVLPLSWQTTSRWKNLCLITEPYSDPVDVVNDNKATDTYHMEVCISGYDMTATDTVDCCSLDMIHVLELWEPSLSHDARQVSDVLAELSEYSTIRLMFLRFPNMCF